MAFRVDDIIVSSKNVMLLSNGRHYIADIEKNQEIANSYVKNRDRNPWNLKTEDGTVINNVFDVSDFTIRTQVVTGSSGMSTNYKQSHEKYFMPNADSYVGICQFYDSAYTISDNTTGHFTTTYNTASANQSTEYSSDDSFIRYDVLSTYDNMVDYYITPNTSFLNADGTQFLTEYPINKFYSDFGDNEDIDSPTIYGDSCPLKFYLNENYSVSGYSITDEKSSFERFRTYYGIGNSGNSIYIVYRNDLNATSTISSNNGHYIPTNKIINENYIVHSSLSGVAYMSNITTLTDSTSGLVYAADPYSDFFSYDEMSSVSGYDFLKQPKDNSFILFFKKDADNNATTMFHLPRNGLDKSISVKTIGEILVESNIIELEHSILIPTNNNGLINAVNQVYDNSTNNITTIGIVPFRYSEIGCADDTERIVLSGGTDSTYKNFRLYFNGKDIIGAFVTATVDGNNYDIPMASSKTYSASSDIEYDMGRLFMPIGNPSYELTKTVVEEYSPWTETISSVPSSYTVGEETLVTYVLSSVTTRSLTGTTEVEEFCPSANAISEGSSFLFDYSPVFIDDEIDIGSYAFIQFSDYGLAKVHANDIFSNRSFVKSTTTGPSNRKSSLLNDSICTCAHFDFTSYNEDIKSKSCELVDFVGSVANGSRVYGKPALLSTFCYKKIIDDETTYNYYNTFSTIPFINGRENISEPTFYSNTPSKEVEQTVLSSFNFILNEPIKNSNAVSIHNYGVSENINHDAAISLVRWNEDDGIATFHSNTNSLSGLHLQYNGICTEMFITGKKDEENVYTSTVYEYPHPCFGDLKTAGTGLSIFDGELSSSMTVDDIFVLNNYLIVKNYAVENMSSNSTSESVTEKERKCGKIYSHDTGNFVNGGYVVTNFYTGGESNIPSLYDSVLISSSKEKSKTSSMSETVYDYNYLWHIRPHNPIEFYPESQVGKKWTPFYALKYVDFIKYHNGYYYIAISSSKSKSSTTIGYDIIETDSLFDEKECVKLTTGRYVSGIKFYENNVCVEYTNAADGKRDVMWFKQGRSSSKTHSISFCNTTSFESDAPSAINRASLSVSKNTDLKENAYTCYDNVEVIHSLNRFNSVVNHKSNIFSIKISDLGLDSSPYLNDTQKKNLKVWFKNRISTIVDSVKPANTQLFDVYID